MQRTLFSTIFVFALVSAAPAFAQDATTTEAAVHSESTIRDLVEERSPSGARFFAYYDTASTIHYTGVFNSRFRGAEKFTGKDNFSGAPGLAAEYILRNEDGIGFSSGFAYEFSRKGKDFEMTFADDDIVSGKYGNGARFSLFLAYANANWSFGRDFYVFAGPNYALPSYSKDAGSSKMTGGIGFQGGIGWNPWNHVDVEALYQRKNLKYSEAGSYSFDNYRLDGVQLRVGYRI